MLAVRANHALTVGSGRTMTAAGAAAPARRAHRLHWPAWRRRHQHRARQAHQRWNAYAETTP